MAINFTSTVNEFATTAARTARAKNFTEFTSKKKLEEAAVLTDAQLAEVLKIKGTFTFALHNDGRYMVITLYHATAEKKYQFLILDLNTFGVAEAESVKSAKALVMEQVAADAAATATEEPVVAAETPAEEPAADEPKAEGKDDTTKGKKGKRTNK